MSDAPPLALAVDLPAAWCHLSLVPERDGVEVPAQVDQLIAGQADLAPARQALIDLFLGWASSASGLGATMAAMRYDEDPVFGVAMATLLVLLRDRDPAQSVDAELAALRDRLGRTEPADQHPPHVDVVTLPIGRSVRLEAVRDPTTTPSHPEALRFVLQHWIPLAGSPYTLEFEATTSNLVVAPQIAAEVDAIVASVTR